MEGEICLPRDWGPHSGARSEWWYFTGRLLDDSGTRWSYLLSFFRSSFSVDLSRFAHFLLTSANGDCKVSCERALSPFGGRPKIRSEGLDIDYDGWTAKLADGRFRIVAGYRGYQIDLTLPMGEPMQTGREGRIDIGRIHTHGYSVPRLEVGGEITIAGRSRPVTGISWFDHEWGSIPLPHQWNWWGINLEDGSDLVLRESRGESLANLRRPDRSLATSTRMNASPTRYWQAPGGGRYPIEWQISLPEFDIELEIRPERDECETPFHVVYWEGLCQVTAKVSGGEQSGRGYMELVGYGTGIIRFVASRLARLAFDYVRRDRRTDFGRAFVSEGSTTMLPKD